MLDFKGHRFEKTIILLCVRWYLAYPLSYRNLEEMMEERGVRVDHSNIYRWVRKFTPQLEAAFRKGKKRSVGKSWRVDETYIKIKGQWKYLYRAVDREGQTIDFLLTAIATRRPPCASSRRRCASTACRTKSRSTRAAPMPRLSKHSKRKLVPRSRSARSNTWTMWLNRIIAR